MIGGQSRNEVAEKEIDVCANIPMWEIVVKKRKRKSKEKEKRRRKREKKREEKREERKEEERGENYMT